MVALPDYLKCDLCSQTEEFSPTTLQAKISSSERAFAQEVFTVWQCNHCDCIHSKEGIDLENYYDSYGLHAHEESDIVDRFFFNKKMRWLEKSGMKKEFLILDYGCGSGTFVRHLSKAGYKEVYGYDPFVEEFANTKVLEQKYDLVMSSDVIEHDVAPLNHLLVLQNLCSETGTIYLQTPKAEAIDLKKVKKHRQILQQPFHRHILSEKWLLEQMKKGGWVVQKKTNRPFFDSSLPFINLRTLDYYADRYGGLIVTSEKFHGEVLLSPKYWGLALLGGFFPQRDEVQAIFCK